MISTWKYVSSAYLNILRAKNKENRSERRKKINEGAGKVRWGFTNGYKKEKTGYRKVAKAAVIELSSNGSNC